LNNNIRFGTLFGKKNYNKFLVTAGGAHVGERPKIGQKL